MSTPAGGNETSTLSDFDLPISGRVSGKVREAWALPNHRRLLVTTDRLSSFDRIIGLVPYKGQVLNQLSAWWFSNTTDIVANHFIEAPDPNATIALDAKPLPVEVVVRSRLTGSTSTAILPKYLAGERLMYGHQLPEGLSPHGPLHEPIITPTTKADQGLHDEPITVDEVQSSGLVEPGLWAEVQKVALSLFERATTVANEAGFVLADTKYEFGLSQDNELLLIDEVHTPDSSRYWLIETLEGRLAQGLAPEGFDKEPVRLALAETGFGGEGELPALDEAIWLQTSQRFRKLYESLTKTVFEPGEQPATERLQRNLKSYVDEFPSKKPTGDTK